MHAVVFDLELVKRFRKGQLSEIVEIGACKVDLHTKTVTDYFQIYISPKSGYVSKSTRNFINMKKEDVKKAVPFAVGIQKFIDWLGDNYYLCSWGKDDRLHFINQCLRNKLGLEWFRNYNDIQRQIGRVLNPELKNQLGLKNALQMAGIEAVGKAHRGIDDAVNTAELLIKFHDQIELQKNSLPIKEIMHNYKMRHKSKYHNPDQARASRPKSDNPILKKE